MTTTQKKRILLCFGNVAGGHKSAADALCQIFSNKYHDHFDVQAIDLFSYADPMPIVGSDASYKKVSSSRMMLSFNNLLWKGMNTCLGHNFFRQFMLLRTYKTYRQILLEKRPDLVVSIHPYTNITLSKLHQSLRNFKYAGIITDLVSLDRGWLDKQADLLICPTSEAMSLAVKSGVAKSRVVGPLFPIQPKMQNFASRDTTLDGLNFDRKRPMIMVTGGGIGTGSMLPGIDKLAKHSDWQVLIIAGRNNAILAQLKKRYSNHRNVVSLGFVDNMQDYLYAATVVVAKPGPATILEIELYGTNAVLTSYIGPQEAGNIRYGLENPGFRYIGNRWDLLEQAVSELLNETHQKQPRRRFDEAEKIVEELVKLAG